MIDMDRVIREAAVKNRLVVRKDDEVMILATIINQMLDELEASLAAALEKSGREHNELARRWRRDAEAGAERVLNAALGAGREAASRIMTEGADKVTALINRELASAVLHQRRELDAVVDRMRRHSFIMLGTYGALLVGTVLVSLL